MDAPANITHKVPLIIRGEIIEDYDLEFGGRRGGSKFSTPDVAKHLNRLKVSPAALTDQYRLSFAEIVDYLDELGSRLNMRNPWFEQALAVSLETSGLTEGILRNSYEHMGGLFCRAHVMEAAENAIGVAHLDGWVESQLDNGCQVFKRAFGARTVHVVAGNVPTVSALSIVRNAMTRGDALIKAPSNDPLTAVAIARTMIEMAPDHPLTKHLSVAYWKGGNTAVEEIVYQPANVEKIVAWGGVASITHIAKYIQPGIDLITLDPKLSSTIVGQAAFDDDGTMRYVAEQIAYDACSYNQEGCGNARVVYIQSGTDKAGIAKANLLGEYLWDAIRALPDYISGPARAMDPDLKEEIESMRLAGSRWHKLIGGNLEGGVIISQLDEPVDFARILGNRVINLVPVDDLDTPVQAVNAYTQTIGIYPDSLKDELRDRLALYGAQRLAPLGYGTTSSPVSHGVQDALEPLRRMCKWIVDERFDRSIPLGDIGRL
jgi:hypothetical protein